jgi:hypothetical protein
MGPGLMTRVSLACKQAEPLGFIETPGGNKGQENPGSSFTTKAHHTGEYQGASGKSDDNDRTPMGIYRRRKHDMQEDAKSTQHITDTATWINTRGMNPSPSKLASVASSEKGQWQSDRRNYAARTTAKFSQISSKCAVQEITGQSRP